MGGRVKRKIYMENPERRIMRRQKLKTKVHLCVLLGDRGRGLDGSDGSDGEWLGFGNARPKSNRKRHAR